MPVMPKWQAERDRDRYKGDAEFQQGVAADTVTRNLKQYVQKFDEIKKNVASKSGEAERIKNVLYEMLDETWEDWDGASNVPDNVKVLQQAMKPYRNTLYSLRPYYEMLGKNGNYGNGGMYYTNLEKIIDHLQRDPESVSKDDRATVLRYVRNFDHQYDQWDSNKKKFDAILKVYDKYHGPTGRH